jgi:hypothetical protein
MPELAAADRIEVLVLVDNVTDSLSSAPDNVENELPVLRGAWSVFCHHGLAWRRGAHAALRHRPRRVGFRAQC